MTAVPAGYTYDRTDLEASPVAARDLDELLQTVLWTPEDEVALRRAGEVLEPQVEQLLDVWYGFVAGHPFLVRSFAGRDGAPDAAYLAAVRSRFARWVHDLCARPWDQRWLDYQHEVGLRHHTEKKNATDGIDAAESFVPLRYLVAFVVPITATVRGFLAAGASDAAELEAMHTAWFKAVALTVALWTRPYSPDTW